MNGRFVSRLRRDWGSLRKIVRGVDPLVKALKDKDGAVRTAAVWALERIGDPRGARVDRGADR